MKKGEKGSFSKYESKCEERSVGSRGAHKKRGFAKRRIEGDGLSGFTKKDGRKKKRAQKFILSLYSTSSSFYWYVRSAAQYFYHLLLYGQARQRATSKRSSHRSTILSGEKKNKIWVVLLFFGVYLGKNFLGSESDDRTGGSVFLR